VAGETAAFVPLAAEGAVAASGAPRCGQRLSLAAGCEAVSAVGSRELTA